MGGGFQFVEIIILALVAAFIALRLRSVLGRRTGQERPSSAEAEKRDPNDAAAGTIEGEVVEASMRGGSAYWSLSKKMKTEIDTITRRDRNFDLEGFLDGAEKAYSTILEGFWSGDKKAIQPFLSETVYQQFHGAIKDREKKGQTVENRLIDVSQVKLKDVLLDSRRAELTVEFMSDIVAVTKDKEGKLVEGDLSDSVQVTDIWTFARELGSRDPNWVLVATRAG